MSQEMFYPRVDALQQNHPTLTGLSPSQFDLNNIKILDANIECLDSSYFNAIDEEDEKVSDRISV